MRLRKLLLFFFAIILFTAVSLIKYVDSYPEWAKLEYLRLTDLTERNKFVYYNFDAIRADFVGRLNERDQLAPEGLEDAFLYESMQSGDDHILKVIVSIEKQLDGSWKLTDSGEVFPIAQYAESLDAALDDFESISENMPAAMVRASFLKTYFDQIQYVSTSSREVIYPQK